MVLVARNMGLADLEEFSLVGFRPCLSTIGRVAAAAWRSTAANRTNLSCSAGPSLCAAKPRK
jgi:hypothetical protein